MVDVVARWTALIARYNAKKGARYTVPAAVARFAAFNGVPRARRQSMAGRFYPESSQIPMEKVSRRGFRETSVTFEHGGDVPR
jgi:hypothetical protein